MSVWERTSKDVLGHIAAWEWEAVHVVDQVSSGQRPDLLDISGFDAWNAAQNAAWRERTMEDVLAQSHASRAALTEAISRLDDRYLESPEAFPYGEGSLRQFLDWQHDRHHAADLEAWRLGLKNPASPQEAGLLLGAHMSIAGGVSKSLERGHSIGCQSIQIFTRNQRQWNSKPLDSEEIERFKLNQAETGMGPVVAHDSYLINLGSPNDAMWEKSLAAYILELQHCQTLSIPYLVMHPGSHVGSGEQAGLQRVAEGLDLAHDATQGFQVISLLETTAGQGTNLGYRFEQLAAIRSMVREPERVAICLDTCHVFAAGYELRTPESYAETLDDFDRILGLDSLRCLHLNDCKKELGSHVDRHEHIGKGMLGIEPFRFLMNDPRLAGLPGLLETPKGPEMLEDVENLRVLRSLVSG